MPSWAIHLAEAKKVSKNLNFNDKDKNIFLFGNIVPDILNGYVVDKISHKVSHDETHYQKRIQIENHYEKRYNLEKFYQDFKDKFTNPIVLGYYTHLLTDFYWNRLTYDKNGIFDENRYLIGLKGNNGKKILDKKDNLRKIKTNDFKIFSKYIYKNKLLEIPVYDEKIIEDLKDLEFLNMQEEDVLEALNYLNKVANFEIKIFLDDDKYKIYSEEEMLENLDICKRFIESDPFWDAPKKDH